MTVSTLGRRAAPWGLALAVGLLGSPAFAGDRDGDGVSNKEDRCPDEKEDVDGFEDEDGCRDPSTRVRLTFRDGSGGLVRDLHATLEGPGGQGEASGNLDVSVHPGVYTLRAEAPGHRPLEQRLTVPADPRFDQDVTLEKLQGSLRVTVVDEAGKPLPAARVRFGKAGPQGSATGVIPGTLSAGEHLVRVEAPGYVAASEAVSIAADGSHELEVVLVRILRDEDGDGVSDDRDKCPDEVEDMDGFEDTDGCPDPTVATTLLLRDGTGSPVRGVEVRVMGEGGDGKGGETVQLDLHPGSYEVFAAAPSFENLDLRIEVPSGREAVEKTLVMERIWTTLILYVMDDEGRPIDEFTWRLDNGEASPGDGNGLYAGKMDPGPHELVISAEDHAPARARITLDAGTFAETSIVLYPTLIEVTPDKIEIADKVYFDTGKATIKPESFQLLDQVAAVMLARADIARVRVEGHTDTRGSARFNLQLSDDRAASVRTYLLDKGVAPERLTSVGFGEDQPVDDRNVEEAWEANRRVEFFIEEWLDITVEKEIEPREAQVEVKTTEQRPPLWPGFGILDGSAPAHHEEILRREAEQDPG